MTKLNDTAEATLRDAGLTPAGWARANGYEDGIWGGDVCGCSDDRCVGSHHYEHEECGCLPVLIALRLRERRSAPGDGES